MENLLQQFRLLAQAGLWHSAEIMGNFLLSSNGNQSSPDCLITFADVLFGKEEYLRASNYYRKGLTLLQKSSERANKKSATGKFSVPVAKVISTPEDDIANIKYKIAQCLFRLNDTRSAVQMLESISVNDRTLPMNMHLARYYHQNGNENFAVQTYKQVIKDNPFAMEAILALIELGVSPSDLLSLYGNQRTPMIDWIEQLMNAHKLQCKYDYKGAIVVYNSLETQFTNNLYLLQQVAKCEVQSGYSDKARVTFEKIRKEDSAFLDSMDTYASIVKASGNSSELNRLSQQLLKVNHLRPEPWTTVAMYCELKGKRQEALSAIDKALELDDRHVIGHLLKGNLWLASGHPEDAVQPFRKAYNIQKDILAFAGLVRAYLGVSKVKEALTFATEAKRLMPQNPQALSLLGLVLSQPPDPNYRKRAKQCFEEALKIDSLCLDAVIGLSQLYTVEGKYQEAMDMLAEQIKHNNKDFLHTRLAELLVHTQKHAEALEHFNIALSLNPNSEIAKRGLERLERVMKGQDPDKEEEEDEDEQQEEVE